MAEGGGGGGGSGSFTPEPGPSPEHRPRFRMLGLLKTRTSENLRLIERSFRPPPSCGSVAGTGVGDMRRSRSLQPRLGGVRLRDFESWLYGAGDTER
jgi:hypothetical protein